MNEFYIIYLLNILSLILIKIIDYGKSWQYEIKVKKIVHFGIYRGKKKDRGV